MAPMQPAAVHLVPAGPIWWLPLALSAPPCTGHRLNEVVACMCWLLSHSPHTTAGGSKKRGADIAGMPSKRSKLADRLGPAGMSTLAVLLGHDVTQADLDRLQQVGAAEAGQAVGTSCWGRSLHSLCTSLCVQQTSNIALCLL